MSSARSAAPSGPGRQATGRKKKKPSADEIALQERIAKERLAFAKENADYLARLLSENQALRLLTTELGRTLQQQVGEKTAIVKDLDQELSKAEQQIAEWRHNKDEIQAKRDEARQRHDISTQGYMATHKDAMMRLEKDLDREQLEHRGVEERERETIYDSLQQADDELEAARRQHQLTISDHEHKYLLEKERLQRDMLHKIGSTKLALLDHVEGQLHTLTQRTILEFEQVTNELRYQVR